MNRKTLTTGTGFITAMLAIAPLIAGCGNFWKASTTATTTTLAASTATPVEGASVTLTATISPTAATGTVTFYDGTTTLGTGTLSSGSATLTTSFSTTGTHTITATYEGSTTYATSTSSAVTLTCSASSLTSTTTTLAASSSTPTTGQDVTLTATVSSSAATGTVTFYEGSHSLGSSTLSSGTATLTTSFSTAGTYSLTAVYSGDTTYATSTSAAVSITVTASSSLTTTTTSLASTSYSTTAGTSFTLTATVSFSSTGDTATAATGTVEFYDTTTSAELGTGTLSSGTATLATSLSVAGTHEIDAIYGGDSSYATSTSSTISVVIASSSSSTPTIMLSVSPTTVTYGTGVALAAIVTPLTSTGTVTFYDNGTTELGTADLVSGSAVAALTLDGSNSLALGSHTITAKYSTLTSSATAVTVTTATSGSFTSAAACGYTTDGATGAEVLSTGTLSTSDQSYSTSTADQNAICVTGTKSYLTLIDPTITSSSATTVDGDSSWYGLDAAVLDYNGGDLTIDGGTITTSGSGGNMVYSYGTGTITISNATLSSTTTSTSNNHGIYAAGAGTIVANNLTASSAGASSSIVATDSGGGSVTINGGTYEATGGKSAGIYSTGSITAYNGTFTSTIAEAAVIEGANLVKLYNSTLNAGSDGSSNSDATHRAVFLYQSNSGDATNTSCNAGDCFYMTNGTLNFTDTTSSSSDPSDNCSAFAVYNQSSVITLTDVTINNSCGTLLLAGYNDNWSNSDAWGYATLKSYGTTLTGNIVIGDTCLTTACTSRDTTSTGAIYLYKDTAGSGSTLTGEINNADIGKTVSLTLDAASKWVVTGTSYLTSLTDADTTYSNITCATAGCQIYNGTTLISPAAN